MGVRVPADPHPTGLLLPLLPGGFSTDPPWGPMVLGVRELSLIPLTPKLAGQGSPWNHSDNPAQSLVISCPYHLFSNELSLGSFRIF